VSTEPLRLMVIGAHPDDADFKAGGLAALYRQLGHTVRFVSVTDGSAGHHRMRGAELAARRRAEAAAAGAALGIEYHVWDNPDGRLVPDLDRREEMIRAIRSFRPDLVLTHRLNDYHPDHRATSQLVQDSCYLLTVPAICPDVPHLRRDPVVCYLADDFTLPTPLIPSVVVDITPVWGQKIAMLHEHRSQFYEWLPYNMWSEAEVPADDAGRMAWLSGRMAELSRKWADRYRARLRESYGHTEAAATPYVEAFEASEYGARLDQEASRRLFPFVPVPPGERVSDA
jgi:LmbE family N-acetylglucosaminyl deacetylase